MCATNHTIPTYIVLTLSIPATFYLINKRNVPLHECSTYNYINESILWRVGLNIYHSENKLQTYDLGLYSCESTRYEEIWNRYIIFTHTKNPISK